MSGHSHSSGLKYPRLSSSERIWYPCSICFPRVVSCQARSLSRRPPKKTGLELKASVVDVGGQLTDSIPDADRTNLDRPWRIRVGIMNTRGPCLQPASDLASAWRSKYLLPPRQDIPRLSPSPYSRIDSNRMPRRTASGQTASVSRPYRSDQPHCERCKHPVRTQ